MSSIETIKLSKLDLGAIREGIESRRDAWRKTAEYHRVGFVEPGYIVEECNDEHEADAIADDFARLLDLLGGVS